MENLEKKIENEIFLFDEGSREKQSKFGHILANFYKRLTKQVLSKFGF